METYALVMTGVGALAFGVVIGWVTYRTLRNSEVGGLADIATVIGAVGGAAVTALFPTETGAFGAYCIGLAIGFFAYLRTAIKLAERYGDEEEEKRIAWLGPPPGVQPGRSARPGVSSRGMPND